ncbi:MAG TPA: DUF4192 domain-containing protein [Jatrophihabitantaceae bacterium]|jgi:hypothetical protein
MTDTTRSADAASVLRVRNPGDLIEAIPYLLGFHPRDSLVIVGLADTRVSITARIDLDDLREPGMLGGTLRVLMNGQSTRAIAAIFAELAADPRAPELPHRDLIHDLVAGTPELGIDLIDAVLVAGGRWWSYHCADHGCCPPEGRELPGDASPSRAAATYAGLVAVADRDELAALLDPHDDAQRAALEPAIAEHENLSVAAVVGGYAERRQRSVKRAIFAAARDGDESLFPGDGHALTDDELCRFAVALSETPIRDAVWLAVDQRRLDGRALWREIARRVPPPYDAAPLFLFGWASWRDGNGAAAGIAAERAMASDPAYTAAELLLGALAHGLDPHRTPRLRMPKSA